MRTVGAKSAQRKMWQLVATFTDIQFLQTNTRLFKYNRDCWQDGRLVVMAERYAMFLSMSTTYM